jgi:multimeric flavodoxin WrbA
MIETPKLLILVGSPRRAGNSATLAKAVQRGAEATGAEVSIRFVDDFISSFLRDCRTCRLPSGECSIADRFRALFFEDFIPAQGVIFCSPVYWYGLSAQMKAFFDRSFCYYAASYPDSARVIDGMSPQTHRLGARFRGDLPRGVAWHRPPDAGVFLLHAFRVRWGCPWRWQQPWRGRS